MESNHYIPIIDFTKCGLLVEDENDVADSAMKEAGMKLYRAFATCGFAYISNTGIPRSAVNQVNSTTQTFYNLPLAEKKTYSGRDIKFSYDPPNEVKVDPRGTYDLYEGLRIGGSAVSDKSIKWPDVPELGESMSMFADLARRLARRVFKALGTGIKLKDPDYFCNCHSLMNQEGNTTHLKASHYYPVPDDTPKEGITTRIGEHTDAGSITLLFQDEIGGLQVKDPEGNFVDAHPIPDTALINIGDELQFWSGYRLKSTVHRVLCPTDSEKRKKCRRVIAYFVSADNETSLDELEFAEAVEDKPVEVTGRIKMTSMLYIQKRFNDMRPLVHQ